MHPVVACRQNDPTGNQWDVTERAGVGGHTVSVRLGVGVRPDAARPWAVRPFTGRGRCGTIGDVTADRWMRLAVAVGVGLRVVAVIERFNAPLPNDSVGYLDLARNLSWFRPWETGPREPLWVLLVKCVTGPFGYSATVLQLWGLMASLVSLLVAAWVFHRWFSPAAALVGTTIVAIHPLLLADAASTLREATSVTVVILVAWAAGERRWTSVVVGTAVLAGIRWELGLLAIAVLALGGILGRLDWRIPAGAVLLAAVWIGPFMASNAVDHGDVLYHTDVHASFFRALEEADGGRWCHRRMKP